MSSAAFIAQQYALIKSARQVLFDYCASVYPEDFVAENRSFGRGGSMRNLLVHIANTYQFWVGTTALQQSISYTSYESCEQIADVRQVFSTIDILLDDLLQIFESRINEPISYCINNNSGTTTLPEIFLHVITHEFHHKGQILSISRHLGYLPVDTDIIRSV